MKTMPRMLLLNAVVLASLSGVPIANAADGLDVWCEAQMSLDASGKVTSLEFSGKNGNDDPIAKKMAPVIRSWSFVPGSVNGVPAQTETTLTLHLRTVKSLDGNYGLRVLDAHTGAASLGSMAPPKYPHEALINGLEARVIAAVSVGTDGVPTKVEIAGISITSGGDHASRRQFETALSKSAMIWRIRPEVVGGHPVAAQFRVPVDFCLGTASPCMRVKEEVIAEDGSAPMNRTVPLDSQVKLTTQVIGTTL